MNDLIDEHVSDMIKMQVDMDNYFQTDLPMFRIIDKDYVTDHENGKTLVVGYSQEDHNVIQKILKNELFEKYVKAFKE